MTFGACRNAAQGESKGGRIAMQFALMDRALFVAVQEFDGVLDGEDVDGFLCVHAIQDGSERGGFAGTRRPSDQSDAVPQVHNLA
jgi:hypothetical protein